ncbi:MAG: Sulfoacetaldehyde reductase [Hyphomicrobiales bacterium]|nr:Sulfoacetaldehyde reductase [Hyphomicrobiales bacterium]
MAMNEHARPRRGLALITGASEGIGVELARIMAARGHDLALVARQGEKLAALATEIEATCRPRPLIIVADLSDVEGIDRVERSLSEAGADVEILVNNAGFGLLGSAMTLDSSSQLGMVDLNMRALTDLTLRLLPGIVARRGRVLNVASTAAFLPGPYMAVYYASKAYVLSFGQALSQELKASGVTITTLCPGPTTTQFQARAGMDPKMFERLRPMTARSVALAGYEGMMAGKRVVVPGLLNKATAILVPLLPRSLLLMVVARLQERRGT